MDQLQFWCNFHLMHSKIARIVTSEVYCNYTHAQSYPTGAGGSSSVSNGVLLHLQYNTVVCCLQNTACLIMGDVHHTLLVHLVGREEDIVSCPSGFLAAYNSQTSQSTVQVTGNTHEHVTRSTRASLRHHPPPTWVHVRRQPVLYEEWERKWVLMTKES